MGVFSFQGEKYAFLQTFTHSYLPFPLFKIHVIVLYKDVSSHLIDTSFMEPQTFTSLVAYWQHISNIWLWQY
jgi:hypothetical protein